jgi:hypothetical protein
MNLHPSETFSLGWLLRMKNWVKGVTCLPDKITRRNIPVVNIHLIFHKKTPKKLERVVIGSRTRKKSRRIQRLRLMTLIIIKTRKER